MYFYMYKTINKINNKIYIGVRQSTVEPNIDNYLGSGKLLKKAINHHGKENFEKEILELFDSREEMFAREKIIVNDEFVKRRDVYNLCLGGNGGPTWNYLTNKEESIKKLSSSLKNFYDSMTKEEKAQKYGSSGEKNPMYGISLSGEKSSCYGKPISEERRQVLLEFACTNTYIITSPSNETTTTKNLSEFCRNNNLSRRGFMHYMGKGIIPLHNSKAKEQRINTTGWSIYLVEDL